MAKEKLAGRSATEGRVGVMTGDSSVALVKVNCETDFVARNEDFVSMVDDMARGCLAMLQRRPPSTSFVTLSQQV